MGEVEKGRRHLHLRLLWLKRQQLYHHTRRHGQGPSRADQTYCEGWCEYSTKGCQQSKDWRYKVIPFNRKLYLKKFFKNPGPVSLTLGFWAAASVGDATLPGEVMPLSVSSPASTFSHSSSLLSPEQHHQLHINKNYIVSIVLIIINRLEYPFIRNWLPE